jgi:cysteinyl-tRNA synthetase
VYGALERLSALVVDAPETTLAKLPRELEPFAKIAGESRARVDEALDDDLNTPVVLAVLADLAKAANELADLAQKRRKDASLWKGVPHVASQVSVALRSALDAVGLLQTPAEVYHTRSRARRLAVRGLSPEQIDAKLAERRAARDAKDFARGDALRAELEGLGVEVADTPTGTTWRVLP